MDYSERESQCLKHGHIRAEYNEKHIRFFCAYCHTLVDIPPDMPKEAKVVFLDFSKEQTEEVFFNEIPATHPFNQVKA